MPPRTAKTGITVASIKASELYGVLGQAVGEAAPLSEETILQKLYAAEDFYERDLTLRWTPTRVFSTPQTRAAHPEPLLRVTDFDPIADLGEAAYDYPRGHWEYERHGFLKLRQRPIRAITQVVFTWAGAHRLWAVPPEWIQSDARAGTINIVPTSGPEFAAVAFNSFLLMRLGSGFGLPHSIVVDYTVGFTPEELDWQHQDLLNGVRLRALLMLGGIVSTIASGGGMSQSLGLDGLSHARGFGGKYGAYSGAITLALEQEQEIRETWRAKERGVPMAIV